VPIVRPFRALRYDLSLAGEPVDLVSPPYDVISPEQQGRLAARSPYNAVHVDFPPSAAQDPEPDPYRRAARSLTDWRTRGVLRKDRQLAIYPYEQRYSLPGSDLQRTQRGFFARLQLEPFVAGGPVRPHERTMGGPKEDRYQLLRATGVNTSAVVVLYDAGGRGTDALLERATGTAPVFEAIDDDGTCHRLWSVAYREGTETVAGALAAAAGAGPVTIADGHHRYETSLRYRDERALRRACAVDPPYEFVFVLLLDAAGTELTVLPTHRVVVDGPAGGDPLEALAAFGSLERLDDPDSLADLFRPGSEPKGAIGVFAAGAAALLRPSPTALVGLVGDAGDGPLGRLEVVWLGALLERVSGIDPGAAAGGAIRYTREAGEAIHAVAAGEARSAFLLPPVSARDVIDVAATGATMPPKSTYFFPKPLTGPLYCPLEW
jgi:uncharacterized protein (DUF1015 family)